MATEYVESLDLSLAQKTAFTVIPSIIGVPTLAKFMIYLVTHDCTVVRFGLFFASIALICVMMVFSWLCLSEYIPYAWERAKKELDGD